MEQETPMGIFPHELTPAQRDAWEAWFNELLKRGPVYTQEEKEARRQAFAEHASSIRAKILGS